MKGKGGGGSDRQRSVTEDKHGCQAMEKEERKSLFPRKIISYGEYCQEIDLFG